MAFGLCLLYLLRKPLVAASASRGFTVSIKCLDGEYPFFDRDVSLAVKLSQIRSIFEAKSCLDKARALKDLTIVQLQRLFPKTDGVDRWRHVNNLLRIADRLHLQAHDGTHAQCAQCEVINAVRGEPFNEIVRVAKHKEPKDQLREAMARCLYT